MPRSVPSYRLHKPSGRAVVTLGKKDFYLGRFGSAESRQEYARLILLWEQNCQKPPDPPSLQGPADLTVAELVQAYERHAAAYYIKNGKPTSEPASIGRALAPVRRLFGFDLAAGFGPRALKEARQALIEAEYCRSSINKHVGRIVRCFKWGSEQELVPPMVWQGLKSVPGLRRGRTEAKETKPVRPVPDEHVDAIKPHVSPQLWAMIQLMRLTGGRVGEINIMRTCDLDTSKPVWTFRPESHKTEHHDRSRVLWLGPKAQEVVKPWLRTSLGEYLFSPREAELKRRQVLRAARKTPLQPSQQHRRKKKPRKVHGDHYPVTSVGRAVRLACMSAKVPHWHPHQLRHNAATFLRREYGIEVARVILGHATPAITETYAEIDDGKARSAMQQVG